MRTRFLSISCACAIAAFACASLAHAETLLLEIRRNIQQAEWRIGLHHEAFVRIFIEKIAVCEKDFQ